jgi:hypothetical protein
VQLAAGVVDLEALAERVERVRLAREALARQRQAVGDADVVDGDRRSADALELDVEKADVEGGVVDDDLPRTNSISSSATCSNSGLSARKSSDRPCTLYASTLLRRSGLT